MAKIHSPDSEGPYNLKETVGPGVLLADSGVRLLPSM